MKRFFLGAATAAVSIILALIKFVPIVDCYATRYDHIDVDAILNNRRMVNYYASCLLNTGPCPPQGVELKRILPEALQTTCEFCTEKQKTVAYRSIKRLKKEYPKIWKELSNQWDPDGAYIRKFETIFEANQSKIATSATPSSISSSSSSSSNSDSAPPSPPPPILNRFGGDEEESNVNTITTNSKPSSTTNKPSPTTTISSTIMTARTTTKRPSSTSSSTNKVTTKRPPLSSLGTNIQATVSYGVNVFNGIVNGLGELGRGVVETGARLADAVVTAVVGSVDNK